MSEMERLTDKAAEVFYANHSDNGPRQVLEATVRAVLTALLEPDDAIGRAMHSSFDATIYNSGDDPDGELSRAFTAAIKHILEERP